MKGPLPPLGPFRSRLHTGWILTAGRTSSILMKSACAVTTRGPARRQGGASAQPVGSPILRRSPLHDGDPDPRRAIWSRRDPVTVLGAWKTTTGQQELDDLFAELAARFSNHKSSSMDIIAVDVVGDMADTVGYEHTQTSVNGEPRTYVLRATQIYRREDGE